MPKLTWSINQVELLKEHYPFMSLTDISLMVGHSEKSTKTKAKVLKLKKIIFHFKKTWTEEEDNFLKINFLTMLRPELAKALGKTESALAGRIVSLKLSLPEDERERRKKASYFSKGHVSYNKGRRWQDYMSPEQYQKQLKTSFKKGNLPKNTLSDGVVTIRNDKSGRQYKWIRISKAKWRMLHVYNWEGLNGKTPAGHILVFKDGDSMNCDPSNIRLITRAQHASETRNKDGFIAKTMSGIPGGKGLYDKKLYQEILKNPELIELKRTQLNLNRQINEHYKTKN